MKRFHVSMLLTLLCSLPLCAMDDQPLANITQEDWNNMQVRLGALEKPSMLSRACSGAVHYATVPVNAVQGRYANLSEARKDQISAAAYFAKEGSIDAAVYAAAQTELVNKGVQRIFNNEDKQAGLAVCSAVVQGLRKVKDVWSANHISFFPNNFPEAGKITRTLAVALAVSQDVATNVVVAKAKSFVANNALSPLAQMAQEKYGINVCGSKLLNVAADLSSWIVFRRVVEKGAKMLLVNKKQA